MAAELVGGISGQQAGKDAGATRMQIVAGMLGVPGVSAIDEPDKTMVETATSYRK